MSLTLTKDEVKLLKWMLKNAEKGEIKNFLEIMHTSDMTFDEIKESAKRLEEKGFCKIYIGLAKEKS